MADWVKVGAGEIGEGEITAVPVGDRTVAIANVGGNLHAFDDICTHEQCSLAEGELDGLVIQCPCHGSQFDITSGEVVNGPATEPIDVFEVREEGGELLVALDSRCRPSSIIGANMAGGTAAATLREEGFDGRVVLIGREPHPPYERPPLSKEYLRGEQHRAPVHPAAGVVREEQIETRFGDTADRIDVAGRSVELVGGERIAFDSLLVATGCRNRKFPIARPRPPGCPRPPLPPRFRRDQGGGRAGGQSRAGRHGVHRGRGGRLPPQLGASTSRWSSSPRLRSAAGPGGRARRGSWRGCTATTG